MKIIAKKGTAFEQTIKSMCEKMTAGVTGAQDLVAKAAGKKMGRPTEPHNSKADAAAALYKNRPIAQIMETLGVKSNRTIYKYLKQKGIKANRK